MNVNVINISSLLSPKINCFEDILLSNKGSNSRYKTTLTSTFVFFRYQVLHQLLRDRLNIYLTRINYIEKHNLYARRNVMHRGKY